MKKIKNSLAFIFYRMILLLVKIIPAKNGKNHLLIIKTDEIGDYILFRNLFIYFRKSEMFHKYKITLVGNIAWEKLFEEYDHDIFDGVIWLEKSKFKKNLLYRVSFLNKIRNLNTSNVINCVFSRSLNIDDGIAYVAKGKTKFAMNSDDTNRGKSGVNFDNFVYSSVLDAGDEKLFDAVRNKNFVMSILKLDSISFDTKLKINSKDEISLDHFFIIFIGAGNPERKWPISYYVDIAKYIGEKYCLIPVICGGLGDCKEAEEFIKFYKREALNLAGKTSLPYLMELLSKAIFLVCVDTGTLHMAAAAGCPVIGLFSGKFYGRFAPYPKEITEDFYPVYPDFVDNLIAKNDPVLYNTFIMKNDTMKLIHPAKLIKYIDAIMDKFYKKKSILP